VVLGDLPGVRHPTKMIEHRGMIDLIDLAGSERLKVSGASGLTAEVGVLSTCTSTTCMQEAIHINQSLSALFDVMHALKERYMMLGSWLTSCFPGKTSSHIATANSQSY